MTQICHEMMRILFMPKPPGPQSHEGDHQTGLNISMLKAFLIKRLGDMVSMAYAAASAADIPQSALELYAPKDGGGKILPRAANNFTWSGLNNLGFDLNVTGCAAGNYTIIGKCFSKSAGYDFTPSGMPGYGLVDSQERGHGAMMQDEEYSDVVIHVAVPPAPANADASTVRRVPVTATIPESQDGIVEDLSHRYVIITGDAEGRCNIGRSSTANENGHANPTPGGSMPRATGHDATSDPHRDPNADKSWFKGNEKDADWAPPMKIHNDQFKWDGHSVTFRLEAGTPAPSPRNDTVNVTVYEHNWVGSDDFLETRGTGYSFRPGQTVSEPITAYAKGDTPYIQVHYNGKQVGESKRAGHDSGHDDEKAASAVGPQNASNFVWNGSVLRFRVEPESSQQVFVEFKDSFQKSDILVGLGGGPTGMAHGTMKVPVVNGFASADSSQIPHNVKAHVYNDASHTREIGVSAERE
jgi:hypothetical protein